MSEAEDTIDSLNEKVLALEKIKERLANDAEELQIEVDRAATIANTAEKKAKGFEKIIGDWKLKVDNLTGELDASQKECRHYSTELFRLKGTYEEVQEKLENVQRENRNLAGMYGPRPASMSTPFSPIYADFSNWIADEIKDLMEQIAENGRNIHEVEKARKRLEVEKNDMQGALEEAEAALEHEENKVLRAELELSQIRQEIDKRMQEKEVEFEHTR